MIKAIDPAAVITDVRVGARKGGTVTAGRTRAVMAPAMTMPAGKSSGAVMRALAVTVSNRAAAGVYPDRSGPVLVDLLRRAGCDVVDGPLVIPDGDPVEEALRDAVAAGYDVVVTTGGTGLTPTDQTPEMTGRCSTGRYRGSPRRSGRPGPRRGTGRDPVPGLAGLAGRTLIVNLPGSTGGVRDGMAVLGRVLAHAVDQVHGGDHRPARGRR